MNPALLLNPKAFAKQQAAAKSKARTHGPEQTSESASSARPQPTYDPNSLLRPHAAAQSNGAPTYGMQTEGGNYGARNLIENLNNVISRDDVPTKRRKIVQDDDDDDEKKKQNAVAAGMGGSGMLSDRLKEDRKKFPALESIDLTNDDDKVQIENNDDEMQIMKDNSSQEVCLGFLNCTASTFKVPEVSQNAARAVGKDRWPRLKIKWQRQGSTNIIHLTDRKGNKFGTVDPRNAAALCQILTGVAINKVRLDMYLPDRPKRDDEHVGKAVSKGISLEIHIFAPRNKADSLGKFLSQKQMFLRNPLAHLGIAVFNPQARPVNYTPIRTTSMQAPGQVTVQTVQRTEEEVLRATSSMFDTLAKLEKLPEVEANGSIITSELMPHQKQALYFLLEHERNDFDNSQGGPEHWLWKYKPRPNGRDAWSHILTGNEVLEKPDIVQGGILADVMGLGKTLSILALIAHTREQAKRFRAEKVAGTGEYVNARGTLIICPKSVLSNWQEQIRAHTKDLKVYTYHGSSRTQDFRHLSRNDIVLTTYNTAACELSERAAFHALPALNWFRIVLDEAHSIRTQSTQISKACCAFSTSRRWAVTGTPVQNHLNDLGALMKFLRLKPFDTAWGGLIITPFKMGDVNIVERLQVLVGSVTLRRYKGTLNGLPKREEHRERLEHSKAEALLYQKFARSDGTKVQAMTQGGKVLKGRSYAYVLKTIGRLRMICAHGPEMLSEEDLKEIEGTDPNNAIVLDLGDEPEIEDTSEDYLGEKEAYKTYKMMLDSEVAICECCSSKVDENPDSPDYSGDEEEEQSGETEDEQDRDLIGYLNPCYHLICKKCCDKHKAEATKKMLGDNWYECQYCSQYIRFWLFPLRRSVLEQVTQRLESTKGIKAAKWDENSYTGPHTKVRALLEDLKKSVEATKALPPGEPPFRSVVFSGWTSYLDLIEYALDQNGIGCTRIDGKMSIKQRSQALETFNTVPHVTVLLVSIKAGGQGLNFTAANTAYVMEPQFNPGVEAQAVDRVHRIGQTRDVTIKHFIIANSIEEVIVSLQKKKEDLAKLSSMQRKRSKAEETKERLELVKQLFK